MSTAKKMTEHISSTPDSSTKSEFEYNWRVLIVEDEPAIAEGIKAIIAPSKDVIPINRSSRNRSTTLNENAVSAQRKDQFEVVWAKNPTEALNYINESVKNNKPFALGFFDVLLGSEIDGIELVRQIQLIDPKIYAVFLTAYHDRTVDSIHHILGADKSDRWDYLNKPFTEGTILQKARNSISIWNLREQKRLQDEQLAEASNLLRQGERTSTVAAVGRSVAHEFGNLLMHIVGHAELALLNNDESQIKNTLKTIIKAGETAAAVLGKFKKMHGSEQQSELKVISINQCIDESIELMAHEFKKRNIQIYHLQYETSYLEANHHSLIQVFVNLFINASHAMSPAGRIDISVKQAVHEQNAEPTPCIEIRIRDYGPGVPVDLLPKITDAFFTTKGKQGTGLGLAICKDIIEDEHQGEFLISNHPDKGLEILIKLPTKKGV